MGWFNKGNDDNTNTTDNAPLQDGNTTFTIALVGRAPLVCEAANLGDALTILNVDSDQATFRANGQQVGLDFAPGGAVTVMGAKNLVGA